MPRCDCCGRQMQRKAYIDGMIWQCGYCGNIFDTTRGGFDEPYR